MAWLKLLMLPFEFTIVNNQYSTIRNGKRFENAKNGDVPIHTEILPVMGTQQSMCAVFDEKDVVFIAGRPNLLDLLRETEIMGHKECLDISVHPFTYILQISPQASVDPIELHLYAKTVKRFNFNPAIVRRKEYRITRTKPQHLYAVSECIARTEIKKTASVRKRKLHLFWMLRFPDVVKNMCRRPTADS